MGRAFLRAGFSLLGALAVHLGLTALWLGLSDATLESLPVCEIASIDLSFSETPQDALPRQEEIERPSDALPVPDAPPPRPLHTPTPLPPPPEPLPEKPLERMLAAPLPVPVDRPSPATHAPATQASEPPPRPPTKPSSPAPAPSQARIDSVKPPQPRQTIKPEYPRSARERGEEGTVALELDVTAHGRVAAVRIVASCGFGELEKAAVAAVRKAHFAPARKKGKPVDASVRLTLDFRLKKPGRE